MANIKGIDVSKWQGIIDWNKVKADGVKFTMIRVGYATTLDDKFHFNIKEALKVGIDVGVYLYSYAITPTQAKKEAEFVLKAIKGYNISYPVVYDLEDKSQEHLSKSMASDLVIAFCNTVDQAGYTPMLYSNLNWLTYKLDCNKIKKYDIWLAQWTSKPTYDKPFTMWQYTEKGRVAGITANLVDLNIGYKDYGKEYREMQEEIKALKKANLNMQIKNDKLIEQLEASQDIIRKQQGSLENIQEAINEIRRAGAKARNIILAAMRTGDTSKAQAVGQELLDMISKFE